MENIYTVKEVSKMLKTSIKRIYTLIESGELKAIKIGIYKITETELQRFLNQ
ncbi:helix-turn-helix domain-containing protein [Inconstantimicrobium mannanitabidum]|uniref:Uncharacterized protein n=1 Tax=Inconstantimicrobium mannanitabidum TaxID=1604901 RepID=A0ACB5R995_9CLOT|nr:helix-turn-helix domain-containing protein [Clostridium sp. TW13]GKX65606.1 hypothetical protein rsdtw13_08640 [Clostridium sp. TW13]